MPRVTWLLPWQLTLIGRSSNTWSRIEMSCGARSQATLMSFWNSPRFSRRAEIYCTSPMSPASTISFMRRTAGENRKVWPTMITRPSRSASATSSSASASVRVMGFSMKTCLPMLRQALAIS